MEDSEELIYWRKRCELAEDYIQASPCDPDIYENQLKAFAKWVDFIKAHEID